MAIESLKSHSAWIRKRKVTTIAFTIQSFLFGIEDGVILVTLWLYLKTLVNTSHPKIYYCVISVSYIISSAFSSLCVCKFADKTRNIRISFFVMNTFVIVGNLIYTIHLSPWILVLGRILSGFGAPLQSLILAELTRSYEHEKLTSKYSIMALSYSIGLIIGPGINCAFATVDLHVWKFHITYVNIPGIYIAVMFTVAQIINAFILHDLSKEYDMKSDKIEKFELLAGDSTTYDSVEFEQEEVQISLAFLKEQRPDIEWFFKQVFSYFDTSFLIFLSFFEKAFIDTFRMTQPILIIDILKWSATALNGTFIACGVFQIIPCVIVTCVHCPDNVAFRFAILGLCSYALIPATFIVLYMYHKSFALNVCLVVINCVVYTNVYIIRNVVLAGVLAKMVASRYQSFTDSFRLSFLRLGTGFAFSTAPFILSEIKIAGPIYIAVILILISLLLVRRKTLSNPKIIIHP